MISEIKIRKLAALYCYSNFKKTILHEPNLGLDAAILII
jgi:hypothetical protein